MSEELSTFQKDFCYNIFKHLFPAFETRSKSRFS